MIFLYTVESRGESRLRAVAEAPGYITVAWDPPTIAIPDRHNFSLNGHYFLLNLTHTEGSDDHLEPRGGRAQSP